MSHEPWSDSPASYALGALPEAEAEAFEVHLATCAACRAELDELLPAVHALPASVEPVPPPPSLKARIMAEVEREAALLAAAGPEADRPSRARARPRRRRPAFLGRIPRAALAGGLAALVVGVGAGVAIDRTLHDRGRTVAATMLSPAKGARAEVDLTGGNAMLVASGLHPAPSGRVYQIWLQRPGHAPEPTSALFMPNGDGSATATVPGPLSGVRDVLVTDEPPGGSRSPTGKLLLQARIGS